jgi:hypothetical protein
VSYEPVGLSVVVVWATVSKAAKRGGGKVRPLFVALFSMPAAALADSEYFSGMIEGGNRTSLSESSNDEHSSSALRHSEESAIQSTPRDAVPEVGQRFKKDSEVPTAVAREDTGNIFKEDVLGFEKGSDPCELEEQS